jgi:uncharacterized protein (DUF1778 family)
MTQQNTQFNIRMAVENKLKVERAARAANQSLTEFAEAAVVQRAEEVLERQERILLSDRDFERFVQLMTAEAAPTETALREAAEFNQGKMDGSHYQW